MHPALKLFSILWLFMGTLAVTIGATNGFVVAIPIGLVLMGLSIAGILGHRVAPMGLTYFWLSILLSWIVLYLLGHAGSFLRTAIPCFIFGVFAFIAFLCGEDPNENATEAPESKHEHSEQANPD